MSRKTNIINNVISTLLVLAGLFAVVYLANVTFGGNMFITVLLCLAGSIVAGLINAFVHEWGHIIAGKINGFTLLSYTVWFFNWTKRKGKLYFSLVMIGEEAGYTEMVATSTDNLAKRFSRQTLGGIIASFIMMLIGIVPIALLKILPYEAYCFLAMFFPIGIYYFVNNALPMSAGGVKNDGGVIYGIKKGDDNSKVVLSLLAIQSQILNGKTPGEIEEGYYFNLPQLPEDDLYFSILLNSRYCYYLDKGDFENAKKVASREEMLAENMPKSVRAQFLLDALYGYCTFNFNEEKADEIMYDCERFLNKVNTCTTIRVKMAYMVYVLKDKTGLDTFYEKGLKECRRTALVGLGAFEKKLLDKIKLDGDLLEDSNLEQTEN